MNHVLTDITGAQLATIFL